MKKIYWLGCIGLLLFEIANIYFIMPMPGSQRMNSIDVAYFLYTWRWVFRGLFALMIITGLLKSTWKRKWIPAIPLILLAAVIYMTNFKMAADAMFKMPKQLITVQADKNKVDSNRLVIGVSINGKAKAYPIQFLGYHHQVQDTIGGKDVLVTYCTVCRTGRVFDPFVNGKKEKFRLVGMDHFNAMLEDATTKSWWQQATGKAITGKLKGYQLSEVFSTQTTLTKWLLLNPSSEIMQADSSFISSYSKNTNYEDGSSRDALTGTDSLSWKNKSWVVGIRKDGQTKAYDWNQLKKERIINDKLGNVPVTLVLSSDNKSFFVWEKISQQVILKNDTLTIGNKHFTIDGKGIDTACHLMPVAAYQEFWHSWQTFNPATLRY
jgi:Protein of unknown function (DUF3179)